jgi:hypothetical protein
MAMGTNNGFDGQSGRVLGTIATNFPKFSGKTLQYLVDTECIEEDLTAALCPVWNNHLEVKGLYAIETYHFCYRCKVTREFCPAYKFDLQKLRFMTFQQEGEELIFGSERIKRLSESTYLPISPLMFASLADKQKNALFSYTASASLEPGLFSCDAFIFSGDTRPHFTFRLGNRNIVRSFLENAVLEGYFVTSFYNWGTTENRWTVRDNALLFPSNQPIYSVVVEP